MKCETLFTAIGEINDSYICDYDNFKKNKHGKKINRWIKYASASAAAAAIILIAVLAVYKNKSLNDTSLDLTIHYFESFEDFAEFLPENCLLLNFTENDSFVYEYSSTCVGQYQEEDFYLTEPYDFLTIYMYSDSEEYGYIYSVPDYALEKNAYNPLHETESETYINGVTVIYGSEYEEKFHYIKFTYDENIYYFQYCGIEDELMFEIVKELISEGQINF